MANTSAPLSEVAVASMAASLLDEYNITSLDEDTPICRFMSRQFGYVRDEVLQLYPWHFANKRAVLDADADDPAFGWNYSYTLPADYVRLHSLRVGGYLDGEEIPHELEGGHILTDKAAPLYIRYTFRQTNIAKWRPLVARVFANRLAVLAATRVTGKDRYYQKAVGEFRSALFEATHADTLERGTAERVLSGSAPGEDVMTVRGIVR